MTVSTQDFLLGQYQATKVLGNKAIISDATLVIEGYRDLYLLAKQFPHPEATVHAEIDVPTPMGANMWQPGQLRVAQQGPVSFMETVAGHIQTFMTQIIATGATFNATVYEGVPTKFSRAYRIRDCFGVFDAIDRDWENRTGVLLVSGTLHYHYFGELTVGNA